MFEQLDPPEPTPSQIEDAETVDHMIDSVVYRRMRDPDYVIDALSVLITDSHPTQNTLANLIMGFGDTSANVGYLRCDVRAEIRAQAERDYERGQL